MKPEQRYAICQIRLERAIETLQDAQILFNAKRWRSSINRVYYAMFYSVSALANAYGFSTSKYSTLEGWFNKTIIHTGIIPKEKGKMYREVFVIRSECDYDDLTEIEPNIVQHYLYAAASFIETLRCLTLQILEDQDKTR